MGGGGGRGRGKGGNGHYISEGCKAIFFKTNSKHINFACLRDKRWKQGAVSWLK